MEISPILQSWYLDNKRELPWRDTQDAYRIWLSEIILQQTRVAQGYDYYMRFTEAYPTVQALAAAPLDDVLKLWQGLGYYSRARNLHKAAQQVAAQYQGHDSQPHFPNTYRELLSLPGVGPYTAAAIASFSSGEAVAVVDGNVYRVLARLFDIALPIDSTAGQKYFQTLADELLDPQHPGSHNQAIMEFGALQCTPAAPRCETCPLQAQCLALANGTIAERPVKAGRVKVRERHFSYYIYKYNEYLWVHQRGSGDIWEGLWEYYMEESEGEKKPKGKGPAFTLRHQLTHQLLLCDFYLIELEAPIRTLPADYLQISWEEWQHKAVPKPIADINRRISTLF